MEFKIGDLVNCNLCPECGYTFGQVIEDYGNSVLVSWGGTAGQNVWAKSDLVPVNYSKNTLLKGCYHDWKDYFGINEQYKYCTKCDEKT